MTGVVVWNASHIMTVILWKQTATSVENFPHILSLFKLHAAYSNNGRIPFWQTGVGVCYTRNETLARLNKIWATRSTLFRLLETMKNPYLYCSNYLRVVVWRNSRTFVVETYNLNLNMRCLLVVGV